jgi:glucose-1-phosphatase
MKKLENIDFLIFDLGNVIIDIDYDFSINELKKLLPEHKFELTNQFFPSSIHKDYERGLITSEQFRNEIRLMFQEDFTDAQIDHVWNSLLKDIPQERIDLLTELRKIYGTAILSNTNEIHIDKFDELLKEQTGLSSINALCDKVFLSHKMGLSKPDPAIYLSAISDIGVPANRVLFFDDLLANLEGAKSVGIYTHHINHKKGLVEFFGI